MFKIEEFGKFTLKFLNLINFNEKVRCDFVNRSTTKTKSILEVVYMRITIKLFASLREAAGSSEITLKLAEELNVQNVIRYILEKYAQLKEKMLISNGQIKKSIQILLNGRNISANGLNTKVKDGDVIAILPAVGGG